MWIVMSGGTHVGRRAFERNAVNLTKAKAQVEAERRNAVERAEGRDQDQVLWFAMDAEPMEAARKKFGLR